MELTLETFNFLEDNKVFIHYRPEHYNDGSNLCFSIEFIEYKTQTGWYNDNHEFGNTYDTMKSSLQIAVWYLENTERIKLINSGYHDSKYILYVEEKHKFIKNLLK